MQVVQLFVHYACFMPVPRLAGHGILASYIAERVFAGLATSSSVECHRILQSEVYSLVCSSAGSAATCKSCINWHVPCCMSVCAVVQGRPDERLPPHSTEFLAPLLLMHVKPSCLDKCSCCCAGPTGRRPGASEPEAAGDGPEGETRQEQHHLPRCHVLCHVPPGLR